MLSWLSYKFDIWPEFHGLLDPDDSDPEILNSPKSQFKNIITASSTWPLEFNSPLPLLHLFRRLPALMQTPFPQFRGPFNYLIDIYIIQYILFLDWQRKNSKIDWKKIGKNLILENQWGVCHILYIWKLQVRVIFKKGTFKKIVTLLKLRYLNFKSYNVIYKSVLKFVLAL